MPKKVTREIPPNYKPRRLDVALHHLGVFPSRTQAKHAIDEGDVRLSGVVEVKPGHIVKSGDMLEVFIPDPKPAKPQPENIPLELIYEDSDILVIDKPAGMIVHPGAGNYNGTLVNAVLHHCSDLSGIGGVLRPGVVHRLDKETSGVLVMAKNDAAHQSISKQFKDRTIRKVYLAIVIGKMPKPEGNIESPIGRHPTKRTKMRGAATKGRSAETHWKVLEVFPGASLIEVKPHTGRTHQIRVHLSEAGHSVVGDRVYGARQQLKNMPNMQVRTALLSLKRHALHARRLTFTHPSTGKQVTFESPLPHDMRHAVEGLRNA